MANHYEQDQQSLMLHTEAINRMRDNPALIDRALSILERWMKKTTHPSFLEWQRILQERDWDAALSISEYGNQIRQSSPCSCTLPDDVRLRIIRQCRAFITKDKTKLRDGL